MKHLSLPHNLKATLAPALANAATHLFGCCGGPKIAAAALPVIQSTLPMLQTAGMTLSLSQTTAQMLPYAIAPLNAVVMTGLRHRKKQTTLTQKAKTFGSSLMMGLGVAVGFNALMWHGQEHAPQGTMQAAINPDETKAVLYKRDTSQFFLCQHRFLMNEGDVTRTDNGVVSFPVTEISMLRGLALRAGMMLQNAQGMDGVTEYPMTLREKMIMPKLDSADRARLKQDYARNRPLTFFARPITDAPTVTAVVAP